MQTTEQIEKLKEDLEAVKRNDKWLVLHIVVFFGAVFISGYFDSNWYRYVVLALGLLFVAHMFWNLQTVRKAHDAYWSASGMSLKESRQKFYRERHDL